MKKIVQIALLGSIIASCSADNKEVQHELKQITEKVNDKTTENPIIRPFKNLKITPNLFTLNAQKKETVKLKTGSSFEIPANSLVDSLGNPIKGEYTIHFNEYHSLTDILLSGIPMTYDSSNTTYNFVSGGMFDIKATQNNSELFLTENAEIKVNIASTNEDEDMNFYALNEDNGVWDYKDTKKGEKKKVLESNDKCVFLDIQLPLDSFPELKDQTVIGWKTVNNLTQQEKTYIKNGYNSFSLSKETDSSNYNLEVTNKKIAKSFPVKPYTYSDAKQESKQVEEAVKEDYTKLLEVQNNMEKRPVTRSISIQGFGIYNWDIVSKSSRVPMFANVIFPAEVHKNSIAYFLITPDDKTIVRYDESSLNLFSLPNKKSCFIAILPDNTLYTCNAHNFKNALKRDNKISIELEESDISLHSNDDLTESLKSLF
jgi:hypothetical protein